jgi:hypothetical protein
MNIYIFMSEKKAELRAFAGDAEGRKLPSQFRPWHAIGVVGAGKAPPHNLSRTAIEDAIASEGFQLWRFTSPQRAGSQAGAD